MLSAGLLRRVQLVLKLMQPARLLLLDEVTADLDLLARDALLRCLAALFGLKSHRFRPFSPSWQVLARGERGWMLRDLLQPRHGWLARPQSMTFMWYHELPCLTLLYDGFARLLTCFWHAFTT